MTYISLSDGNQPDHRICESLRWNSILAQCKHGWNIVDLHSCQLQASSRSLSDVVYSLTCSELGLYCENKPYGDHLSQLGFIQPSSLAYLSWQLISATCRRKSFFGSIFASIISLGHVEEWCWRIAEPFYRIARGCKDASALAVSSTHRLQRLRCFRRSLQQEVTCV